MITSAQYLERINHAKIMFSGLLFFYSGIESENLYTVNKSANIFGLSATLKSKVPAVEKTPISPIGTKVNYATAKLVQTIKRTHGEIGINPSRRIYSDGTTGFVFSKIPFSCKKSVNHLNSNMDSGACFNSKSSFKYFQALGKII